MLRTLQQISCCQVEYCPRQTSTFHDCLSANNIYIVASAHSTLSSRINTLKTPSAKILSRPLLVLLY